MNKQSWSRPVLKAVFSAMLSCGVLAGAPAMAAAPMVKTSAPAFFRTMLGDFEITAVSDGMVDLPVNQLLKQPQATTDGQLAKHFLASPLETSVNTFLVNTGAKLILIDTGAGALFGPTLGKLLANIKAAGYQPEQVDEIYITHMHPDHVGGLMKDGVIAFPNAIVRADRHDADFWLSQANLDKAPADSKGFFQGAMASVNPYVAAGKFQPFDGAAELTPGISSVASKGHTAGHTSYAVESKGKKLLLVGDLIHVAAVQFDHPAVGIAFDSDTKTAIAERQKDFAQLAKSGVLVGAAHLPFPGMGHITTKGKAAFEWLPVNFTLMR